MTCTCGEADALGDPGNLGDERAEVPAPGATVTELSESPTPPGPGATVLADREGMAAAGRDGDDVVKICNHDRRQAIVLGQIPELPQMIASPGIYLPIVFQRERMC